MNTFNNCTFNIYNSDDLSSELLDFELPKTKTNGEKLVKTLVNMTSFYVNNVAVPLIIVSGKTTLFLSGKAVKHIALPIAKLSKKHSKKLLKTLNNHLNNQKKFLTVGLLLSYEQKGIKTKFLSVILGYSIAKIHYNQLKLSDYEPNNNND